MPATHLMSVDFPAPLSPTSAITSPSRTSKSTACNAWTQPNCLETPRSSRVGAVVVLTGGLYDGRGARKERPDRVRSYLQYFLYWPTQTCLLFRNTSLKRSL